MSDSTRISAFAEAGDLTNAQMEGESEVEGLLSLSMGPIELSIIGSANVSRNGIVTAEADELRLDLSASDVFGFSVGRFRHKAGNARFFPSIDYFARPRFESALAGDLDESALPSDLAQARIMLGAAYVKLSASPNRPMAVRISTVSRWFPSGSFPSSFSIPETELTLGRRSIYYAPEVAPRFVPDEMSFSLEGGATLGPVDAGLTLFWGWDPARLLIPELSLLDLSSFDIVLVPADRRMLAAGFAAAASLGDANVWAEASYCPERAFLKEAFASGRTIALYDEEEPLRDEVLAGTIDAVPSLDTTIGVAWDISALRATIVAEYKDQFMFSGEALREHDLGSAAAAAVSFSLFDSRLLPSVIAIASPLRTSAEGVYGPGFLIACSIALSPSLEREFRLVVPFFAGDSGTVIGRYSDMRLASLSVKLRF